VVISYNLKVFSYFKNVDEFFALEKTVNKSQRHFYECMTKKRRAPYFDIDVDLKKELDVPSAEKHFEIIISSISTVFKRTYQMDLKLADFYIESSHGTNHEKNVEKMNRSLITNCKMQVK